MRAYNRWTGGSGFGRVRARSLAGPDITYYVTANDLTEDRCTVTACYLRREQAEQALEGGDGKSYVFETRARLRPGLRAYHCAGVAWAFEENQAGKP